MSFIVGLNLTHYALLCADTRVSYFPAGQLTYRDDEEKIRKTSVGLITGAGLCDLLDPVKERMAKEEPPHTDAMKVIIKDECQRAQKRFANHPDKRVHQSLHTSGWMLTYITNSEQYFPPGLRIAIMGSADEDKLFRLVAPGTASFLPFSDITKDQYQELMGMAEAGVRPWQQGQETLTANVFHHVTLAARLIRRASEMSDFVAPTFQIGVQTILYDIGLSNIGDVAKPDEFEFKWLVTSDSST